jgi:uncharacterized membrane protein YfcA
MPFDPAILIAALPALLVAGIGKGGFGGAAGFAATPLMALALGPRDAVGVMLPLLMVMDAAALRAFWGRWVATDLRPLMLGLAVGTALGWALFDALSPAAMQLAIGALALGFVVQRVAQRRGWRPAGSAAPAPRRAAFWGAAAGLTSFVAHAGGPPVAMHLLPRGLDKTALQATMVAAFAFVNALKLPVYVELGLVRRETLILALALAPAAYAGIRLGVWLHGRVRQEAFDRIVVVGLALAGAKLAWDGARALLG